MKFVTTTQVIVAILIATFALVFAPEASAQNKSIIKTYKYIDPGDSQIKTAFGEPRRVVWKNFGQQGVTFAVEEGTDRILLVWETKNVTWISYAYWVEGGFNLLGDLDVVKAPVEYKAGVYNVLSKRNYAIPIRFGPSFVPPRPRFDR